MLGRRNLRVKVMQALYGYDSLPDKDTNILFTQLRQNIDRAYTIYFILLAYTQAIGEYSVEYAEKRASKLLPTEEDLTISTRINDNAVIKYIRENEPIQKFIKKQKLYNRIEDDIVRQIFETLYTKEKYQKYCAKEETTLEDDGKIIAYLLKKVMTKNERLDSLLDEEYINTTSDLPYVNYMVQKMVASLEEGNPHHFMPDEDEQKKEHQFAHELLDLSLEHFTEFDEMVGPKLKNWDIERIAKIDLLIIKMALCEMMYFPIIPVKVTINEYIDIVKQYSTPKSKDFVNGVLDKMMKELKEQGKIIKKGRGLLDM